MIYVVFCDRLGNNLFQLATALSLSSEITICVPLVEEYQESLKYSATFFKGFPILNYIPDGIQIYEEPFYNYNQIPYTPGTDLIIKGYFQSYRYFERNQVLCQFSIDEKSNSFIMANYPEVINEKFTSIHVRRGDYLKMLYKHPFCGLKYYLKAIEIIGKNENFIVVSDDITWCKKHIKLKRVIFVENTSPIIDLYIQSFCVNNIISNSSFSWWGAYLNKSGGTVVAPRLWFGFKHPQDLSDLLLPNYRIIDNRYSLSLFIKAWGQVVLNRLNYMNRPRNKDSNND
jgi:hypothetical protein